MKNEIRFLSPDGRLGWLSNFYDAGFDLDGEHWPTVEHYFAAMKTNDPTERAGIRRTATPAIAKRIGRAVRLRPDWENVKEDVMLRALRAKFDSHPNLKKKLLATGDAVLIEAAPFDPYWGSGRDGNGQNRLGFLLMQIRDAERNDPT